ncbi:muts domain V-domain-containing protein [Hyaloraphidium curvatum]|nr:muts domain V-domain-containing protein [Hyaloraphidium curvatum]
MTKAASGSAKKPAAKPVASQRTIASYFTAPGARPAAPSPPQPARAPPASAEPARGANRFSQFAAGAVVDLDGDEGPPASAPAGSRSPGRPSPPHSASSGASAARPPPALPLQVDSEGEVDVAPRKKRARKAVVESDDDFGAVGGSDEEARPARASLYDALLSSSPHRKQGKGKGKAAAGERRVDLDSFRLLKGQQPPQEEDAAPDPAKEARRQEFVRKFDMHVTEEMAAQKRRRGLDGEAEDGEPGEEEASEDEEPKAKKQKTAKGSGKAGGGTKFTPLEMQFVDLRKRYPGVLLVIEVGYKFRFFDDDARTAAKHLGIVAYHDHNFLTCSIPVHRLPVHVKKLVHSGYKVGVVRQVETAALKKTSDNRNAPFTRKLAGLYTKSTMVDDLGASDPALDSGVVETAASGFLMCVWEESDGAGKGKGKDAVRISVLAVQVNTGEVVFDEWVEKGGSRGDFETRLLHLHPAEIILPAAPLSHETERLISSYVANLGDDSPRLERVQDGWFRREKAKDYLAQFRDRERGGGDNGLLMSGLSSDLPEGVQICLAALLRYLQDFGLSQVLKITSAFSPFVSRTSMVLDANALRNLEIFETSVGKEGSLVSVMDRTCTGFGGRMMRNWISKPLVDVDALRLRTDAVEHLVRLANSPTLTSLKDLLRSLPDLERSITRIRYNRIGPSELLGTLEAFGRCAAFAGTPAGAVLASSGGLLESLVAALPGAGPAAAEAMDAFDHNAARDNVRAELFVDNEERGEKVRTSKEGIARCEAELEEILAEAKRAMKGKATVQFVSVAKDEYLLEIKKQAEGSVPKSWRKHSGTKALSRFRTPDVEEKMEERQRYQETLAADAEAAWTEFVAELADKHDEFRAVVKALADLDCLCGLAIVAQQAGYVKPVYSPTPMISVQQARHPMLENQLRSSSGSFVPNDFSMDPEKRCIVLTGPNMGGKSCAVRTLALVCIMAQIGSYVPAESAELGVLDAVHTRMGASDTLQKSTFMVELSETCEIIRAASPRSLVILDELGRGTSTHDGMAVAYATLRHFAETVKSLTVFVTHYPIIGRLEKELPDNVVRNFHMGFLEVPPESGDGSAASNQIVFLYKLVPGIATHSYGLNVARLARLPEEVIEVAGVKALEAEELAGEREKMGLAKRFKEVWASA